MRVVAPIVKVQINADGRPRQSNTDKIQFAQVGGGIEPPSNLSPGRRINAGRRKKTINWK